MIHDFNRDLLVLPNGANLSPEEFEQQMELLGSILYHVENWRSFCIANELIDINRKKIIRQPHLIERILRENPRAFVFVRNKN